MFEKSDPLLNLATDKMLSEKIDLADTLPSECSATEQTSPKEQNHPGPRYSFSTEIPDKYDDFYICALPRDPEWLYVYWEFPDGPKGSSEIQFNGKQDAAQWVLRVKETPDDPQEKNTQFDVPISVTDNNWYVKIPEAGNTCVIECGQLSGDGSFISHASTSHFTPPAPSSVKNQSPEECLTTQSQQLIDFTCDTSAVQNITRYHDRSKTIPSERSNRGIDELNQINTTTRSEKFSDGQEIRYFGSAAIN